MSQANYSYEVVGTILCIEDLGPHDKFKTVTNDAENVLEEIKKELGDAMPQIVIYKDSSDSWDGIEFRDQNLEFYSLQVSDRSLAMIKALRRWHEINFPV